MNTIQRAVSFLGSWRPGFAGGLSGARWRRKDAGKLLGKVLNSTRKHLFPWLSRASQQRSLWFILTQIKSLYTPSSPQLQHHLPSHQSPSPPLPRACWNQPLLCSCTIAAASCLPPSVHGLHGTVSMHRNPTYLFKKPLPCLSGFMIPHHCRILT